MSGEDTSKVLRGNGRVWAEYPHIGDSRAAPILAKRGLGEWAEFQSSVNEGSNTCRQTSEWLIAIDIPATRVLEQRCPSALRWDRLHELRFKQSCMRK